MDDPDFTALKSLQVTIVGLGLMGGSLAMRLKRDATVRRVVGLVRRPAQAAKAETLGAVDAATTDPATALTDADIVIFSTPVRVLLQQLQTFAPFFKRDAIITDVGSTKREIVSAFDNLPAGVLAVGSHPMCGKEVSGLAAAEPTLYDGATWVISESDRSTPDALEMVSLLARSVGAVPLKLPPARHDALVATISHLPFLLSAGLTLAAERVAQNDPQVWRVAASGFRDTSRLAASDVTMMLDILLTNTDMVTEMLDIFGEQLKEFSVLLDAKDEERLRTVLLAAREIRLKHYPHGKK